ncbi:helix-turn-helix domain-containing protein [Gordonia sp. CPCC 205515]|uniref:winged helix-turn-helix transcriptional regulator n=1 Tax=Gordonia sp. CPCC 205515 TaxID=3140791 RepID=UPI003AF3BF52
MASYGQFCPVAKAMELLDERWTILIVRELLLGSRHFNELRRGVPKMSPTLLTKRLRGLERAGVVRRAEVGGRAVYTLTEMGDELSEVVAALSQWGIRWIAELGDADLDPHLLLWDMRRTVAVEHWPRRRTTIAISFTDVVGKASSWWMVVADGDVEVCDFDPGFDVDATMVTDLRTLTRVWRGDQDWSTALGTRKIRITAPSMVARAVPGWLGQGASAAIPRPA